MNIKYHITEPSILCPYCDKEFYNDGEVCEFETRVELECGSCGERFFAEAVVCYSTFSDCELNGNKHVWEMTSAKGLYECRDCYQHDYRKEEDI